MIDGLQVEWSTMREERQRSIEMQIEAATRRLTRLTDVYIEGGIDRDTFEERKLALLVERRKLEDERARLTGDSASDVHRLHTVVELLKTLKLSYEMGNHEEKREILATVSSNFMLDRKYAVVELRSPFAELANLPFVTTGDPHRGTPRTRVPAMLDLLVKHCKAHANDNEPQKADDSLPLAA